MDDFQRSDLVWLVAVEPCGEPAPVVVLAGEGAQALVNAVPELFRILKEIGISERSFLAHSRHAEVLVLHTPEEPASSIAYHYDIARELVADLWEQETPTPVCERALEPPRPGWLGSLLRWSTGIPPEPRRLRACPTKLLQLRFSESGPPASLVDRARWFDALGRYDKARAILEERLREAPDDGRAHYSLGTMLTRRGQRSVEGIAHLRRATELNPEQPFAWNGLGIALATDDLGEALAAFTREAELANDFGAWMNVALLRLTLGRTSEAQDAASRAQEIDPDDAILLFLLSTLARRKGDAVAAKRFLMQAEEALLKFPQETRTLLAQSFLNVVEEARRPS